jgi:hypothetical protein
MTRARAAYAKLQLLARTEYVVGWNLAIVAAGLGLVDEAMEHLESALARREPTLPFLKSLPWFECLAHLPGYRNILRATQR